MKNSLKYKWLLVQSHVEQTIIEAIKAHTEVDQRILEELAIIDTYPDSAVAMQSYARLHGEAPERELYVVHTDCTELQITERHWLGIHQNA